MVEPGRAGNRRNDGQVVVTAAPPLAAIRTTTPVRVAAVDAIPLVREGLRMVIDQAAGLHWLGATRNPQAMRDRVRELRPHVVIVDSAVDPRGELVRDLVAADAGIAVLTLFRDQHCTPASVRAAQSAGARGLLRWDTDPAALVAAIRSARTSRRFVDPGLAPLTSAPTQPEPAPDSQLLTARQSQVLTMIAEGLSERDIADTLLVSHDTVRTHIKQMRQRLGARDRAHAVARGYLLGLLPTGPHHDQHQRGAHR